MDIKASDMEFNIYDIELQTEYLIKTHHQRTVYYTASNMFNQLSAGEDIGQLRSVYVVFINHMNNESANNIDVISYRYDDTHKPYLDLSNIKEVNLDHISREIEACYRSGTRRKPFNDELLTFINYY